MKSLVNGLIVILLLGMIACDDSSVSKSEVTNASEFVESLSLGSNFYNMSFKAAQITTTYRGIAAKFGETEAKNALKKYLSQSTEKRQMEWNKNLAESYLVYFSESELISIGNEGKKSPFLEKFQNKRVLVGSHMQKLSSNLLKGNLSEALKNMYSEIQNNDT